MLLAARQNWWSGGGGGRLPAEYCEVDFLQTSGSQYIDLETANVVNIGVKISVTPTANTGDMDAIIGFWTNEARRFAIDFRCSGGYWSIVWKNAYYDHYDLQLNKKYDFLFNYKNDGILSIDGTVYRNNVDTNYTGAWTSYLCRWNYVQPRYTKAKYYETEVTAGEEVIRHLVPCYRRSDRKPGMYDMANDTFRVNKGSRGDFTYGYD